MKRLIHIIFLLFSITVIAQEPAGASITVLDYVDEHMNEKVAKGVCFDLVRKAFEQTDRKWYKKTWYNKSRYTVNPQDVMEGDIVVFRNCIFPGQKKIYYHIAIVYYVYKDGHMTIAEQNACGGPSKRIRSYGRKVKVYEDSVVELNDLFPGKLVKGKLTFYRF